MLEQKVQAAENCDVARYQNRKQRYRPALFSCLIERRRVRQHAIDAYWIGNVLDLPIAQRLVRAYQFVFDFLIYAAGDVDISGVRNSFEAHRDVEAIAVNLRGRSNNDITEMDAYPV